MVTLVLVEGERTEIARWQLADCWPSSWCLCGGENDGSLELVEAITLVTRRIDWLS